MAQKEFCECGGSVSATGPLSHRVQHEFNRIHTGPGHEARVTREEAARIRELSRTDLRKKDRLIARQKRVREALQEIDAKVAELNQGG